MLFQQQPAQAQGAETSRITIRTNQTSVYEGGLGTFILERYGGDTSPLTVEVSVWEADSEGTLISGTDETHTVEFGRGSRVATLSIVPYVDGTAESGAQTLYAQVLFSDDSSYQLSFLFRAGISILDPPADNSVPVIGVSRHPNYWSVVEGETAVFNFTRTGGDTTQPLTIDIEPQNAEIYLRGDYWDSPPDIPTQVRFEAGVTSVDKEFDVPDDSRRLNLDIVNALIIYVLPSADYLLSVHDEDGTTSAQSFVNDNDAGQELELNFGKDGTNNADVDEGDTIKLKVKRVEEFSGYNQTVSFTVRVETDRTDIRDYTLEDWETDYSYTPNRLYKDFELEITGADSEVERTLEVPEDGIEEGDWSYWARILPVLDYEGNPVPEEIATQYWTVKEGFRETEIDATDSGDQVGTVTLTPNETSVYEGGEVVYTLTRTGGPIGVGGNIGLKTYEPNREMDDGSNPSEQTNYPHFPAWETTITYSVSTYVDGVTEDGTDTLKAELVGNMDYTPGTPSSADVEINDPPAGSTFVTVAANPTSIAEGGPQDTSTVTFTRTGGDLTQELTINVEVEDQYGHLRGNHWDPEPDSNPQITFEANASQATMTLAAPDDQRDLPDVGVVRVRVLPGQGYLLGQTGLHTRYGIAITDNDTPQVLSLNWGYLDSSDSSWGGGDSYLYCATNSQGETECGGDAEGFYYYEDDRNFRFANSLQERWPIHFEVSRRATDTGKTATFVVRVEHNRGWESPRHADWPIDPSTGKHYQEFPLTLTGNQRKVIGRIEILDNGLIDPPGWEYSAKIKRIEDVYGVRLTVAEEGDYWTVEAPRTRTVRQDAEVGYPEFTIMPPDPTEVVEGGEVTFTIQRSRGNPHEPLQAQLRTWEPNRTNLDGTNPTEQLHDLTFPAVEVGSDWQDFLVQTLDITVTATDDAIFETFDLLRIELLSPKKFYNQSVTKHAVKILDNDQPTITLTADETSITEGDPVTFTLTRGVNTTGELIVGVQVDDPGGFLQGDYPGDADGVEVPTRVTFADGETTKTFAITPPDDRRDIADSSLTFSVERALKYEILGTNPWIVQVADNDVAPQVQISFNHDEVEEGEDLVLTITRIGEDKNGLAIPLTGGTVDDQQSMVVGMAPGQSEVLFRYRLPDDERKGPDVEYSFTLQPENLEFWTPTGDTTVRAKIVDNDPYRVGIQAFSNSVDEGQDVLYRITHDGHTAESLQVKVRYSEIGHAVVDGLLGITIQTISVGESGRSRAVTTQAADGSDGDATFIVELVDSDDYVIDPDRASASVIVVDKDPLPVLRFENVLVEFQEDVGTAEFHIELLSDLPVLRDVTVEYQVQEQFISDGADIGITDATRTLTMPVGETTSVIEIPIIQDELAERDETFYVYLRNPVNTTLEYGQSFLRGWGVPSWTMSRWSAWKPLNPPLTKAMT